MGPARPETKLHAGGRVARTLHVKNSGAGFGNDGNSLYPVSFWKQLETMPETIL